MGAGVGVWLRWSGERRQEPVDGTYNSPLFFAILIQVGSRATTVIFLTCASHSFTQRRPTNFRSSSRCSALSDGRRDDASDGKFLRNLLATGKI